jgi:hypothetical protein
VAKFDAVADGFDPIATPTESGPPACCGGEMTSIGSGSAANIDIELWRCLACERYVTTFIRVDGKNFWVGAMGRAIVREQLRIIAAAYTSPGRLR